MTAQRDRRHLRVMPPGHPYRKRPWWQEERLRWIVAAMGLSIALSVVPAIVGWLLHG